MNLFLVALLCCCINLQCIEKVDTLSAIHKNNFLDAVFWEVRPFVFKTKEGKNGKDNGETTFTGILPRIFEQAHYYCDSYDSSIGMVSFNASRMTASYRDFKEVLFQQEKSSQYNALVAGITPEKLVWGPILNTVDVLWASSVGFHVFNVVKADRLAVIVRREEIDLMNKFVKGLADLKTIITIVVLCSCILAVFIWFAECQSNQHFSLGFMRGFSTALWFCIVSMTTVGYGDVVVKTPLGRFVALFWMICGVLLASVFTASLTSNVSGVDSINIFERRVAVLEDSFEAKIAGHDYQAETVNAGSYEEVVAMLRRGDVYAAVVMENVTGWLQDDIREGNKHDVPISIVKTLPANVHIQLMVHKNVSERVQDMFYCMFHLKEEIYFYARDKYTKVLELETIYVPPSFSEMVREGSALRVILVVSSTLIVLGLLYDAVSWWTRIRMTRRMRYAAEDDGSDCDLKKRRQSSAQGNYMGRSSACSVFGCKKKAGYNAGEIGREGGGGLVLLTPTNRRISSIDLNTTAARRCSSTSHASRRFSQNSSVVAV